MRFCAVIVTYNRLELLKGAIESLRNQTENCDILIVNNGSNDGTREWLENQHDLIILNQDNAGGAGGFFTGLKYVAENNYDFAWAMDDDIIANADTLKELTTAYDFLQSKGEKIGILASVVTDADGNPVNIPRIDSKINSTGYSDWPRYLAEGILPIDMATFVSLLIPTALIREIGLPIKEFFIWGDDTEYTLRAARNYQNFYIGRSKIKHLRNGGALTLDRINDPNRIKIYWRSIRNLGYLYKKDYIKGMSYRRYILSNIKKAIKYFLKGQKNKSQTILNGLKELRNFNPSIEYPIVKK